MRLINQSVSTGAFLPFISNNINHIYGLIYINPIIYKQFNIKFSGLNAKSNAFETLIELIELRIEDLIIPNCDKHISDE